MCNDKSIDTCGQKQFAQCVDYEKELPTISKIDKRCVNLEDTTEDLYLIVEEIKEEIPENLKDTVEELQSQIEILQEQVASLQTENICLKDITQCVNILDEDPCDNPITNLGQVLNYILNKLP